MPRHSSRRGRTGHARPHDGTSGGAGDCVYGRQPVVEALRAGRRIFHHLWLQQGLRDSPELDTMLELARSRAVPIGTRDRSAFEPLTRGGHHQGVALEVGPYPYVEMEDQQRVVAERGETPLWLVLDHLEDPHNVGALLRTADACGVSGVVIPKDRAVCITDAVVRASAGAAEHVAVCRVTNLARAMRVLKDDGVWLYGLEAEPDARPYTEPELHGPVGLVLGNEGQGLGRLVRETCDALLRIPLRGRVESLNVSVAGAVVLYEVVRQRELRKGIA